MTQLERATWGATFSRYFERNLLSRTDGDAAEVAIKAADRAVQAMRRRSDEGRLHVDDDLELERRAELGLPIDGLEGEVGEG